MTQPNFRALCAELVNELHGYKALHPEHGTDLIDRACRELATPPPKPPAAGEVAELVALIRQCALAWEPDARLLGNMTAAQLVRAAELLERTATPPPEPPGSPTDEEIRELSGQTWGDKELVRAALERWGQR